MNFPDGKSHEEWLGIVGLNNGTVNTHNTSVQRNLREAYFLYKDELWKKEYSLKVNVLLETATASTSKIYLLSIML